MLRDDRDTGRRIDCLTSLKREKLRRLRRENRRLREERAMLAKPTGRLARGTDSKGSSSS